MSIIGNNKGVLVALMLASVFVLAFSSIASAEIASETKSEAGINALRLGYMYTSFNREEKSHVMENDGGLNGLTIGYEKMSGQLYIDAVINYATGSTDYDGGAQYVGLGGTLQSVPIKSTTDQDIVRSHADVGYVFHLFSGRDLIAPFIGIGGYYQSAEVQPTTATIHGKQYPVKGAAAKRFVSQGRFGIANRLSITDRLTLEAKALGTVNLTGLVSTRDSGNDPYDSHELGFIGSLRLDYKVTDWIGVFAKASYMKMSTGRVDMNDLYYEPSADTSSQHYMIGIEIGRF